MSRRDFWTDAPALFLAGGGLPPVEARALASLGEHPAHRKTAARVAASGAATFFNDAIIQVLASGWQRGGIVAPGVIVNEPEQGIEFGKLAF